MSYDSSRVQLIGPFDIDHADAGLNAGYIALADLAVGTDVIKAWAEVTTQWNSGTSDVLNIGVAKEGALATVVVLASYNAKAATAPTSNARVEPTSTVGHKAASVLEASVLAANVVEVDAATAGAAKVYALIITPDNDGA